MVKAVTCEAWRGDQREAIDIAEALPIRSEFLMRCCECHGRVRVHREANNGMQAHFEHRRVHRGCRRSTKYTGMDSLHPDAIPDKPTLPRYRLRRAKRSSV